VRIFELMRSGQPEDEAEAERLYREILPLILFLMQSLDTFLCYGKRLLARRLGLGPVHDRAPATAPTEFGLACLDRHSAGLPVLP
jgi:4-hydroxy-tetrahydrodipicolinate synthase